MKKRWSILTASAVASLSALTLVGCTPESEARYDPNVLTIYSGREEELIQPLIDKFENTLADMKVEVRYGSSAELAAQILEEGGNTPADLFLSQDAGALGALSNAGMLLELNPYLLEQVQKQYRSENDDWVGITGRARVLVYDPDQVAELPTSVLDLAKPEWKGKIGIAPGNASFQSFVTALRLLEGEDVAADWLAAMKQNAVTFEKNSAILEAVESGQVAAGLINHYYWHAMAAEKGADSMNSKLASFAAGDAGNLVNVSGIGVLSYNWAGPAFAEFLLTPESQAELAQGEHEYPLLSGVALPGDLVPLSELPAPQISLGTLDSLDLTLEMIRAAGLL